MLAAVVVVVVMMMIQSWWWGWFSDNVEEDNDKQRKCCRGDISKFFLRGVLTYNISLWCHSKLHLQLDLFFLSFFLAHKVRGGGGVRNTLYSPDMWPPRYANPPGYAPVILMMTVPCILFCRFYRTTCPMLFSVTTTSIIIWAEIIFCFLVNCQALRSALSCWRRQEFFNSKNILP